MRIESFDNEEGCWNLVEEVQRPFVEVDRSFLWWKWRGRDYATHREWCLAAVKSARLIWGKANIQKLRVHWHQSTLWQNGHWWIDTKTFYFGLGDPC